MGVSEYVVKQYKEGIARVTLNPNKPTILVSTDSPMIGTGLGNMSREIFTRLQDTGKYNIVQHGCFQHIAASNVEMAKRINYSVIPTLHVVSDPKSRQSITNEEDSRGMHSIIHAWEVLKPDVVWISHDPWWFEPLHSVASKIRKRSHFMAYPALDSPPIRPKDLKNLGIFDSIVPYCSWAKALLTRQHVPNVQDHIYHGVDTELYRPLPPNDRKDIRKAFGLDDSDLMVGYIGRNNYRKNLPALMEAVAILIHGKLRKCSNGHFVSKQFDHANWSFADIEACPICKSTSLKKLNAIPNLRLYMHSTKADKSEVSFDIAMYEEMFGIGRNCIHATSADKSNIHNIGASDKELNEIYNAMDVFVSPTTCEGFGMPVLEAMAAGTPVVVTDTTAYQEWVQGVGSLVPGVGVYGHSAMEVCRVAVDPVALAAEIYHVLKSSKKRAAMREAGLARAKEMTWDIIAKKWEHVFDVAIQNNNCLPWQRIELV